jgi:hypothetical protein
MKKKMIRAISAKIYSAVIVVVVCTGQSAGEANE